MFSILVLQAACLIRAAPFDHFDSFGSLGDDWSMPQAEQINPLNLVESSHSENDYFGLDEIFRGTQLDTCTNKPQDIEQISQYYLADPVDTSHGSHSVSSHEANGHSHDNKNAMNLDEILKGYHVAFVSTQVDNKLETNKEQEDFLKEISRASNDGWYRHEIDPDKKRRCVDMLRPYFVYADKEQGREFTRRKLRKRLNTAWADILLSIPEPNTAIKDRIALYMMPATVRNIAFTLEEHDKIPPQIVCYLILEGLRVGNNRARPMEGLRTYVLKRWRDWDGK